MNKNLPKKHYSPGDLIHWYAYYSDMIVKDGGWGMILEQTREFKPYNIIYYSVLVQKDGSIREFADNCICLVNTNDLDTPII